jgi:hypothetical protein
MRFLVFLLALAVSGCETATSPQAFLELTTDRAEYVFDRIGGPIILVSVRNVSTSEVGLAACGGIVLTEAAALTADGWKPHVVASCGPPFTSVPIAPGQAVQIYGQVGAVGTFRFRVPVFVSVTKQQLAPSVSNTFTVR